MGVRGSKDSRGERKEIQRLLEGAYSMGNDAAPNRLRRRYFRPASPRRRRKGFLRIRKRHSSRPSSCTNLCLYFQFLVLNHCICHVFFFFYSWDCDTTSRSGKRGSRFSGMRTIGSGMKFSPFRSLRIFSPPSVIRMFDLGRNVLLSSLQKQC